MIVREREIDLEVRCVGVVSRGQHWGIMLERWYLRRCVVAGVYYCAAVSCAALRWSQGWV